MMAAKCKTKMQNQHKQYRKTELGIKNNSQKHGAGFHNNENCKILQRTAGTREYL